jgi:hypothetical protein
MPSTTQFTKQSHGALCDSSPMGVSKMMMLTDGQQACMMDKEHHNREALCKKKRQERKNGATKFGIKHDDTKASQIESPAAATKKSKECRLSLTHGLPGSIKAKSVVQC